MQAASRPQQNQASKNDTGTEPQADEAVDAPEDAGDDVPVPSGRGPNTSARIKKPKPKDKTGELFKLMKENPAKISLSDFKTKNKTALPAQIATKYDSLDQNAALGKVPQLEGLWTGQVFRQKQKGDQRNQMTKYIKLIQAERNNQNSNYFKAFGTDAEWNKDDKRWSFVNKALERRLNLDNKKAAVVSLAQYNQQLLATSLSQKELSKEVPVLVATLVASNQKLSKNGIGKVSATSLPFYVGRYIDPFTGRIKTIPAMSQKYLNPTNYSQRLAYLQAKVLSKWNSFVRSEEEYINTSNTQASFWANAQRRRIRTGLKKTENIFGDFSNLYKQITIWRTGLPAAENVRLVCENLKKNLTAQQLGNIFFYIQQLGYAAKNEAWGDTKIEATRTGYTKLLSKSFAATPVPPQNSSVSQIQQYAKLTAAFSIWANKGLASTQRALKQFIRSQMPSKLSAKDIIIVQQQLQNADEKINSVVGTLMKDGDKFVGVGPIKQADTLEEFIKSVTDFAPKGSGSATIPKYAKPQKKSKGTFKLPDQLTVMV